MPLPVGVLTRDVSFGPALDAWGNLLTEGTVTFILTTNLVYDGTPILITPLRVPLDEDGIATATLICTDQADMFDENGQGIVNWRWRARVKVEDGPSFTKQFLVPTGAGTLDLDTLVPVEVGAELVGIEAVRTVDGVGPDPQGNVNTSAGQGLPSVTGADNGKVATVVGGVWTKADPSGTPGANGKSAYELAVLGGYSGTQSQWLASLSVKGDKGDPGAPGQNSTVPGPPGPAMAAFLYDDGTGALTQVSSAPKLILTITEAMPTLGAGDAGTLVLQLGDPV